MTHSKRASRTPTGYSCGSKAGSNTQPHRMQVSSVIAGLDSGRGVIALTGSKPCADQATSPNTGSTLS